MLQRWRAVGNTASDLTGLRFEPQTSRSRDERFTARPTLITIIHTIIVSIQLHFIIKPQFIKKYRRGLFHQSRKTPLGKKQYWFLKPSLTIGFFRVWFELQTQHTLSTQNLQNLPLL